MRTTGTIMSKTAFADHDRQLTPKPALKSSVLVLTKQPHPISALTALTVCVCTAAAPGTDTADIHLERRNKRQLQTAIIAKIPFECTQKRRHGDVRLGQPRTSRMSIPVEHQEYTKIQQVHRGHRSC